MRQGLDLYGTPPVAMAGHSPGHHRLRVAEGQRHARRRAARDAPADRRRRLAGLAPSRHGRPRRQVADGVGDQRRPRPHRRTARGLLHRRAHRAAARAVDPQRQALGGHHRHARAAGPLRAVLQQDHREGRGRAQEQAARRRGLQPGLQRRPGRGRLPHPAAGRRRSTSSTAGADKLGIDADLLHEFTESIFVDPIDWVGEVERLHDVRRALDRRPRTQRHHHPRHRTRHPRPRRRHRARRHPGRPAQPVHRRRGPRGGARRGRATPRRSSRCRTARSSSRPSSPGSPDARRSCSPA